ncbi:Crp/Fnr family transcriptional regulator [Nodosilinea sp. LEGE 07298]|uniref:Crp/Fnr family transcriptional regulator n=1 Tax=Nodosilinea sp. LEGE 07298 TaxID=2777970 RepID=UPI00187E89DC|nr:Crp/Fnr family transcriptional regulator [Nodosilinea sp. LEGE 07298]MBE9110844.1 Crp/Fnr family transcriptional regulator [Nodosilinea sp. LEGE 07298]
MQSSQSPDHARPFLTWQRITDWAHAHYRARTFNKDERIPTRSGLLYLVERGAVRLVGTAQGAVPGLVSPELDDATDEEGSTSLTLGVSEEAFLGFVGAGQPFEIVAQSPFLLQSFAHVDQTTVLWLYWSDLDNWPHFRREVLDAFRYQHQRKLLWLSTLGQRRTIDRLLGFLTLLIEEFGEPCDSGYYLPWSLTHAQIGSAIGSTRVTVTRLMGKLRQRKLIHIHKDGLIAIPSEQGMTREALG